jgi:hypothetical protein
VVGPTELVWLLATGLFLLVPWLTVRDALSWPGRVWAEADLTRWAWVVAIVAVPVGGPAWYIRRARPTLRAARSRLR